MDNNMNTNPAPNQGPPVVPGKGKAVASLVLGIISAVFCWFGYFAIVSIILAIVGIVLSVGAKKAMQAAGDMQSSGMATAGLVLSIVSLSLSSIVFIACTLCVAGAGLSGLL